MITESGINKNRNEITVIADLLSAASEGAIGKTRLMYKCNLSSEQIARYLPRLLELNYLVETNDGYQTTGAGNKLLEQIKDVVAQLNKSAEKKEGTEQ